MTHSKSTPNPRKSPTPRRAAFATSGLLVALAAGCASAPAPAPRTSGAIACTELPLATAAPSFSAPLRVVSVAPVREVVGRHPTGATRGADIAVVAPIGYDAADVRRLLACRADAARNDGASDDLLALPETAIRVAANGSGFVARVTARRRTVGAEVWQRASQLPVR